MLQAATLTFLTNYSLKLTIVSVKIDIAFAN